MNLPISIEFAKDIIISRGDSKLIRTFAQQILELIPDEAMRAYLLSPDVAEWLLAHRLMKDPELTFSEIEKLAGSKPGRPAKSAVSPPKGSRRGRPPKKVGSTKKQGRIKTLRAGKGRRSRLTTKQIEGLKKDTIEFLRRHPWSSRKEILASVAFPSPNVYQRLMMELKASNQIAQKGDKLKATYAVKGNKDTTSSKQLKSTKTKVKTHSKPKTRKRSKSAKGVTLSPPKPTATESDIFSSSVEPVSTPAPESETIPRSLWDAALETEPQLNE